MLKKVLFIIAISLSAIYAGSTSSGWTSAKSYNGSPVPNLSGGRSISSDSLGNYWVSGTFDGYSSGAKLVFGSTTLTANNRDLFLYKSSGTHSALLAIKLSLTGQSDDGDILGTKVDSTNNLIVTGWFTGTLVAGPYTLNADFFIYSMFLLKVSSNGTVLWAKASTNTGNSIAYDVEIINNELYVSGFYINSFTLGSISVPSTSSNDGFILKVSSSGVPLGQATTSGSGSRYTTIFASTTDGSSLYLTGRLSNNAKFGSTTLTAPSTFYVAKLSSSLVWESAVAGYFTSGSSSTAESLDITYNGAGILYITGRFYSGAMTLGTSTILTGSYDIFIASLSTNLSFMCANQAFGSGGKGKVLTKAPDGSIWTAGVLEGSNFNFSGVLVPNSPYPTVYLAKVNSNCVFSSFTTNVGNIGTSDPFGITVGPNGAVLMTGQVNGNVKFGSKRLSTTKLSLFTAAYTP